MKVSSQNKKVKDTEVFVLSDLSADFYKDFLHTESHITHYSMYWEEHLKLK